MQETQIDTAAQESQAHQGAEAVEYGRGQRPEVQIMDESAEQEPAGEEAPPTEIALVLGTLINKLTAAGHPAPEEWLGSFENPPLGSKTDTKAAIYLVNRALRLLITERRDIPEADRYGALYSLLDVTELDPWIEALSKVTIPVMVQHAVGKAGLVKVDENAPTEKEVQQSVILSPEENAAEQAANPQE